MKINYSLPHLIPKFADSIHPPLFRLPVYVVTSFYYLFLALISGAFILLGIGRVSTAWLSSEMIIVLAWPQALQRQSASIATSCCLFPSLAILGCGFWGGLSSAVRWLWEIKMTYISSDPSSPSQMEKLILRSVGSHQSHSLKQQNWILNLEQPWSNSPSVY